MAPGQRQRLAGAEKPNLDNIFLVILEGIARYAGYILAPLESLPFGRGFFALQGKKYSMLFWPIE